jgi:hypothetical protein
VDSEVVVERDDEEDAVRWSNEAEVTRANAGRDVGGVGGVEDTEGIVAAIMGKGQARRVGGGVGGRGSGRVGGRRRENLSMEEPCGGVRVRERGDVVVVRTM